MTTKSCRKSGRKHTPVTTARQARFFGAELGRLEKGKPRETDMSRAELKRHLSEWGRKRNKVSKRTK